MQIHDMTNNEPQASSPMPPNYPQHGADSVENSNRHTYMAVGWRYVPSSVLFPKHKLAASHHLQRSSRWTTGTAPPPCSLLWISSSMLLDFCLDIQEATCPLRSESIALNTAAARVRLKRVLGAHAKESVISVASLRPVSKEVSECHSV